MHTKEKTYGQGGATLLVYILPRYYESFTDWGGGVDDSVLGDVNRTAPPRDRTTGSYTWSASLVRIELLLQGVVMSPGENIFVPSLTKTGEKFQHLPPHHSLNDSIILHTINSAASVRLMLE